MRKWLIHLLGGVAVEDVLKPEPCPEPAAPNVDLWLTLPSAGAFKTDESFWAHIDNDPIWNEQLKPWFRMLVAHNMKALANARDPDTILRIQVCVGLLEELVSRPETEIKRLKDLLDNQYQAGKFERERGNENARR